MPATRPKILFVSARLPYPAVEGHQIRTLGVLSELAKDYDIYLLSLLRKHESVDHSNKLGKLCKRIVGVDSSRSLLSLGGAVVQGLLSDTPLVVNKYVSPELKRRFVELADSCQPDIIHLDLLHLASLAELSPRSTPIVLNEHNIESHLTSQRLLNESNLIKRVLYRRENRTLQEFEKNACLRSNLVLACSAEDQQTIEGFGSKKAVQIPNGVNIQELQPAQATPNSKRLVFLGGMAWYPNRLGLQWFVDEVMPLLMPKHLQILTML